MFRNRSGIWWKISFACVVCCGCFAATASVARAQAPKPKPTVDFGVALTGPGGLYAYVPNRWGIMHVNVINRREEPLELFSATYFDDQPTLQYGRKVWLPPRSRMQTWHPVRVPAKSSEKEKTIHFHSLVMDANTSKEVLIRTETGQMQHDGFIYSSPETVTGLIDDLEGRHRKESDESIELLGACRLKQTLNRNISSLTDAIFVPGDESLQALDQLVICDSRPMQDAAGLASIRRWLYSGGHLWVMQDQVDPGLLEMLLGDEFQGEVVDRVGLTTVRIETGPTGPKMAPHEKEFEQPVDFVRTVVNNVEVDYTVNGWPAAYWKTCGQGRLLVTTLGPRGWMEPRPKVQPNTDRRPGGRPGNPPEPNDAKKNLTANIPNEIMAVICSEFWAPRKVSPILPAVLEPVVQEYVGYAIPSRWLIVGLLVGFSGLLAVVGCLLWRMGRLEWLGAVGPAMAVVVSLVLFGIGRFQRHSVPPTNASVQFIQAIPGTNDFLADGQVGVYSPESGPSKLGVHSGGWVVPQMDGMEGTTRRMIWTDQDRWQWHNLPAPAGLRHAKFQISGETPERISAVATFGPDGLTGKLETGGEHAASDVLIATVDGRIGVNIQPDGTFTARTADAFSREQFLSADLLTDEQNRRRTTLKSLLANPERIDFPSQPTMLFWTDPWDLGIEFPEGSKALGAALVAVPLKFERPAAGTEISIAPAFLPFKAEIGPDGAIPAGLWDPLHHEWAEKAAPSSLWLKFQVPPELLPVKSLGGKIIVQVTGPVGKLELAGARADGTVVVLKTWMDPVGTLELPIPDGELLPVDKRDGRIFLRVSGGDPDRPELTKSEAGDGGKTNYWRIESLAFELKAKIEE